jgi:hypothetical protein
MQIAPFLAVLSSVACLAPLCFSTFYHKLEDFREKVIEYKMRVLAFSTNLSETSPILRRIQRNAVNLHRPSCKVAVTFVQIVMKLLTYSKDLRKILKCQIS